MNHDQLIESICQKHGRTRSQLSKSGRGGGRHTHVIMECVVRLIELGYGVSKIARMLGICHASVIYLRNKHSLHPCPRYTHWLPCKQWMYEWCTQRGVLGSWLRSKVLNPRSSCYLSQCKREFCCDAYNEGYSTSEIASAIKLSVASIQYHMSKQRKMLK